MTSGAVPDTPRSAASEPPYVTWIAKRLHIRPFRSWTLRSRIVLPVVVLLAIVSLVIGTVSILTLQASLVGRLDYQLRGTINRGTELANGFFGSGPVDARIEGIVNGPGQPVGTLGLVLHNQSIIFSGVLSAKGSARVVTANLQPIASLPTDGHPRTVNLGPDLGDYRVAAVRLYNGNDMVIGLSLSDVQSTVGQLTLVVLIVTVAGLLLAIALATFIVRFTLRPLERVARTALEVSDLPLDRGDVALSIRVPESDTDVHTEVGKVGSALNRMLGHVGSALSARQASEKKVRQFVADASHELRTPLASIRGYAELTRRSPHDLPDDVTHSIGRIESEATRMTSLVEDLLLLARLDEGRDLESKPVDLSMLLVDTVSDAHAAGNDHNWSLDLPDQPVEVVGDQPRLHQVVANLLANARIHTPPGTDVRVALSVVDNEPAHDPATPSDHSEGGEAAPASEAGAETGATASGATASGATASGATATGATTSGATASDPTGPRNGLASYALITISDNGPGISAEIAPTLFERFVRGDSSRARATGSTGLGLAIVHAVVEAHGGFVDVESVPGNTVFSVGLPLG